MVDDYGYLLHDLFSTENPYSSGAWINHNMEVYQLMNEVSAWTIISNLDEMLEDCGELCIEDDCSTSNTGDINADGQIDVTDIVEIVNSILFGFLDECSQASSDFNSDGTVDVIDLIEIIYLILDN